MSRIRNEISQQDQQEGSDRVIENMNEFSAEEVSGLDDYSRIIFELKNYNTSGLRLNEKNAFRNILQGVLNSNEEISENYKNAVRNKLITLNTHLGGARKRRKSRSRSKSKSKRTKSRSRIKSKSRK